MRPRLVGVLPILRLLPFLLASLVMGCEKTGPVESAEDVARTVSRLEKSASAREAAEARLSASSPYVTWKLLADLIENKTASGEARAAAIRAVVRTQQNLGLPGAVIRSAADSDAAVRAEAIRALVDRADPEFTQVLGNLASAATDPDVKKDLEAAVLAVKGREHAWYCARLTSAEMPEDRALAARTLSEMGNEDDVRALTAAYRKEDSPQLLRQEILLALSKIGGVEAQFFVREQLEAPDPYMRGIAAFAETRLKDPEAVSALEVLLAQEAVGDTRVSAAMALGLIASENAKAALGRSCKLGHPDPRVDLACATAQKGPSKSP